MSPQQDFITFLGCLITIGRVAIEFDIFEVGSFCDLKFYEIVRLSQKTLPIIAILFRFEKRILDSIHVKLIPILFT